MKPKPKLTRFVTQAEQVTNENLSKLNSFTLNELKFHVSNMNHYNDNDEENEFRKCELQRNKLITRFPMANRFKIKRNALNKLPQLHMQHHNDEHYKRSVDNCSKIQAKNGRYGANNMFLVNSLMEILKSEESEQEIQHCKKTNSAKEDLSKLRFQQTNYSNQFSVLTINSTKNARGPKIFQTSINQVRPQNNVFRRRIVSEDKNRLKTEEFRYSQPEKIELLTFYNKFYPGKKEEDVRKPGQANEFNQFIY